MGASALRRVAFDRNAVQVARHRVVVVDDGRMHQAAVVPQQQIVRLPAMAVGECGARQMVAQEGE